MRLHVVVGIIVKDGKILVCQRPPHLQHGNSWEFPGGKIEQDEPHIQALQRELFEELGITVVKAHHFYTTEYQYPQSYVQLECFIVTQFVGTPKNMEGQPQMRWENVEGLLQYDFPEANYSILEQLVQIAIPLREDQLGYVLE